MGDFSGGEIGVDCLRLAFRLFSSLQFPLPPFFVFLFFLGITFIVCFSSHSCSFNFRLFYFSFFFLHYLCPFFYFLIFPFPIFSLSTLCSLLFFGTSFYPSTFSSSFSRRHEASLPCSSNPIRIIFDSAT